MDTVDPRALATAFTTIYDHEPAGVWSAPGRVNLIGEHVDYNQGLCLPIALPQRTWVAIRARDDGRVRLASREMEERYDLAISEIGPGEPAGWGAYAAGVLGILRQEGYPVGGADILVSSDVPVGAGLSSSAALEAAVGAGVSALFDLGLLADDASRAILADICRRAENEIALAPTGGMDQAAALRSQADHALLLDCRDGSIAQVPFDLASAGLVLLVITTRAQHALVDGQYGQRRASCEQAAAILGVASLREIAVEQLPTALAQLPDEVLRNRAEHVVCEIDRVRQATSALASNDFVRLGELFSASHASLRYLFEVSCDELDAAVDTAIAQGALGARMTGGGFGGSAIALVRQTQAAQITAAIEAHYAARGWRAPQIFAVTAGKPAE